MLLRRPTATIGRVEEHGRRRIWAGKRTVVAHVGPEPAGPGLALGQDRHRGVIRMDALSCEDVAPDHIDQRHQGCRGGTHPVRKRRYVEIDAFTLVDVALTMKRQVQTVLGEQNMGQQLGPCTPARNRMRGSRRLGDRFAGPADELLTHVLDHLPLARNELQRLGHVLADLAQSAVTPTWADGRYRIDKTLSRQMLRQGPAGWLAALERWHRNLIGCRLRRGLSLRPVLLPVSPLPVELG